MLRDRLEDGGCSGLPGCPHCCRPAHFDGTGLCHTLEAGPIAREGMKLGDGLEDGACRDRVWVPLACTL